MDKQHIIDEIRRTAKDNGGAPLGTDRFQQETGIKSADWFGRFWARWGDALGEAGASGAESLGFVYLLKSGRYYGRWRLSTQEVHVMCRSASIPSYRPR